MDSLKLSMGRSLPFWTTQNRFTGSQCSLSLLCISLTSYGPSSQCFSTASFKVVSYNSFCSSSLSKFFNLPKMAGRRNLVFFRSSSSLICANVTAGLKTPVAANVPTSLNPSLISLKRVLSGQPISSASSSMTNSLFPSITRWTCVVILLCTSSSAVCNSFARFDHLLKNSQRCFDSWWGEEVRLMKRDLIIRSGRLRSSSKGCHKERASKTNCCIVRKRQKTHSIFPDFPLSASVLNNRLPAGMAPCACTRFFLLSTTGSPSIRVVTTSQNSEISWGVIRPFGCVCGNIRTEALCSMALSTKASRIWAYFWHIIVGYSASLAVLKHLLVLS